MKIAIATSATNPGPESLFEARFGRAPKFMVFDTATAEWTTLDNPAFESNTGAGTQTAQIMSRQGVNVVICSHFGPKAADVLRAAGIKMMLASEYGTPTVKWVLEQYQNGRLTEQTH